MAHIDESGRLRDLPNVSNDPALRHTIDYLAGVEKITNETSEAPFLTALMEHSDSKPDAPDFKFFDHRTGWQRVQGYEFRSEDNPPAKPGRLQRLRTRLADLRRHIAFAVIEAFDWLVNP